MTNQRNLFRPGGRSEIPDSSICLSDDLVPFGHKALVLGLNSFDVAVCRGEIVGEGEPPTEDLIRSVTDRHGWKVERIEDRSEGPGIYPIVVYVRDDDTGC